MRDKSRMLIRHDGEEVYFDPLSWRIFLFLQENRNKPVTTIDIYNDVYSNVPKPPWIRIISQYIYTIRKYIINTKWHLESKFGRGFCYYTLFDTSDTEWQQVSKNNVDARISSIVETKITRNRPGHPRRPERTQAVLRQEITYFTGIPCRRGHVSPRYTMSGACKMCELERD